MPFIPPHGGYRGLQAYQMAEIVFDGAVFFAQHHVDRFSRTRDQMVQAARSCKQNIAEGSQASGTSKKSELKLIGVARASLEELLCDYQDWLRTHDQPLWAKDSAKAKFIRNLCYRSNRSYSTYQPYIEHKPAPTAANTLICVSHQTNFLLDRLLRQLEKTFEEEGGFTERLYRTRRAQAPRQSHGGIR